MHSEKDVNLIRLLPKEYTPIVLGSDRAIGADAIELEKPDLMADKICETCVILNSGI